MPTQIKLSQISTTNPYRLVYTTTSNILAEAAAITANRALISDANGIPTHSATTATEIGYVSGATSNIQTQINSLNVLTDDTEYLLVNSFRATYNY